MSENIQEDVPQKAIELPPIKLAFIIDNEVVDVLHTDDRLAAIFLSNPLVLDVTEKIHNNPQSIIPGMLYNQETQEYYIKQEEEADV